MNQKMQRIINAMPNMAELLNAMAETEPLINYMAAKARWLQMPLAQQSKA
jgi:hypothetical protein